MVARFASLFAHQGGWDEILWVLAPIAVMVWLLNVATRRISRNKNDVSTESSESPD
jgi:hypothetical protein